MTPAYDPLALFCGQSLYFLAALVRFFRLYAGLGKARPPGAAPLAAAHCLGVAMGYWGGVLCYEAALFIFLALARRETLGAAFITMALLRGLDAASLLILSMTIVSSLKTRLTILYLGALLLGVCFFFFSLPSLLRRLEKKIMEFPRPFMRDVALLKILNSARRQVASLAWERAGTLSLLVALTVCGWLAEWLAFFCLAPTGERATADILGRIAATTGSWLGTGGEAPVGSLQPGIYWLGALCAAALLAGPILRRRCPAGGGVG